MALLRSGQRSAATPPFTQLSQIEKSGTFVTVFNRELGRVSKLAGMHFRHLRLHFCVFKPCFTASKAAVFILELQANLLETAPVSLLKHTLVSDRQKNLGWRRRARRPFDFRSKIGDMRGDFRAILFAKSLPYANERPGEPFVARPVSECKPSEKCLLHFFDTLRPPSVMEAGFFRAHFAA